MATIRRAQVERLVKLLTEHDLLEKELIKLERERQADPEVQTEAWWRYSDKAWEKHDALERIILITMAASHDEEVYQAVEEYDSSEAGKTANKLEVIND